MLEEFSNWHTFYNLRDLSQRVIFSASLVVKKLSLVRLQRWRPVRDPMLSFLLAIYQAALRVSWQRAPRLVQQ
ncbi:MAG: hypothetical protein WA883_17860 [Phormidesmis sp.]